MSDHTKEPWWADVEDPSPLIRIYSGTGFSRRMIADGMHPKDARRIVACVNALANVSNAQLERVRLADENPSYDEIKKQRDDLLAAMIEVLPLIDHHGDARVSDRMRAAIDNVEQKP